MNGADRDITLADYLRVLRANWWLILLVAVLCGGVGFGLSALQKKSYDATASLAINDPNQDLAVLGSSNVSSQTPLQLASIHAPNVTRPEVLQRVKHDLKSPLTTTQLKDAVTVGIDPNSFLVTVDAQSRSATQAAAIANGFAEADSSLTNAESRAQFATQATQLNNRLRGQLKAADPTTKAFYVEKLSELQSLASIATPVKVSAQATVPSSPTSPKPARNTAAAAVLGLLLGVALAYARKAFDRSIRRGDEVEHQFNQPVVGRIRSEAFGRGRSKSEAPNEPLADIDAEAFRILRHNVRYLTAGDGVRTLAVTSAMAQEGKSTVAVHLAAANADAGKRTMLIECDLRRPVLADRLGIARGPGLTDYLTGHATPQEVLQVVAPRQASQNGSGPAHSESARFEPAPLVCITAGTAAPRPADLLSSARFQEFLSEVSGAYDSVILDCAPLLSVADTLEIIPYVSAFVLCVRLRKTTREQSYSARAALERIPTPAMGIVLTDVKEREDDYYGYYAANHQAAPAGASR
jgi:Mrp family chromosome partitioning ATPase